MNPTTPEEIKMCTEFALQFFYWAREREIELPKHKTIENYLASEEYSMDAYYSGHIKAADENMDPNSEYV